MVAHIIISNSSVFLLIFLLLKTKIYFSSKALSSVDLSERLLCQLAGGDDYELAFTLPAHIEPPIDNNSNTPMTCIGEVIAVNKTDGAKNVRTEIFYQGQPVTATHPAPFPTWPNLTGYQHFAG